MVTAAAPPRLADLDALEARLNRFLDGYESSPAKGLRFLVPHLRDSLDAVRIARRLPELRISTSPTTEGRAVRRELTRGATAIRTPLHAVSAAIRIPSAVDAYDTGAAKQTLRRKVRAAERRGITWERVTDDSARRALVAVADDHQRMTARQPYRAEAPDNADLLAYDLWLLARSAEGEPLLLSVTPVDGPVGALRYFRTLTCGEDASLARYLMTRVLVRELHARGVHHLVDTTLSLHLSHGLRHFQRMVGFRLVRLVATTR